MFEINEKCKAFLLQNGICTDSFVTLEEMLEAIDDAVVENIVCNGDEPDETGIKLQKIYDRLRCRGAFPCMMKVKYTGGTMPLELTNGKEYEVISEERGWYRLVDDTGEDYLYPKEYFEITED